MAQRIQLKRSSIEGKRPNGSYLEPGEMALNTNASDPGAFFELNDGTIAKIGPAFVGVEPPSSGEGYGPGETWYDSGNATFNVYSSAVDEWLPVLAPFFGGAPTAIFVGNEFPEATDSLANDGTARPFQTLNRACMEIARRTILANRSDEPGNARSVIILLPGENTVFNEPGLSRTDFLENFDPYNANDSVTPDQLREFNPESGGLIVPRGATIFGFDLRKTIIRPTYYPQWSRNKFQSTPQTISPRTSTLKWTGNCYLNSLTFRDKKEDVSVNAITNSKGDAAADTDVAFLTSFLPHGYRTVVYDDDGNLQEYDTVTLSYPSTVSQFYKGSATLTPGEYLVSPVDSSRFNLLKSDGSLVLRNELPQFPAPGTVPNEFLNLTYTNSTHHRLSSLSWVSDEELQDYYVKVQRAFANLNFGGAINEAEISSGENVIVAETPAVPTEAVDRVKNGSPYLFNVSLRSDWGQCGITNDGTLVKGFKSALSCNFTAVSLQNDSEVFEVYYNQEWISLKQAYANANSVPVSSVTNEQAINYLISSVRIEDFRYFYRTAKDIPEDGTASSGLTDYLSDTRHYNTLCTNGGLMQVVSSFAIGPAINYWTRNGGSITVSNANSNFGGQSLRSEGFAGIGTAGGAIEPDTGFAIQGIRRPLLLTASQLQDTDNHRNLQLNAQIASVDSSNNSITLSQAFNPSSIHPFTLRPGTVLWVRDLSNNTLYSSVLAATPLSDDLGTIFFTSSNDNITGRSASNLDLPFVRRFVDPRSQSQRDTHIWVSNTSAGHRPPSLGTVMRFAETPNPGFTDLVVTGKQLDPGPSGGWNHIFSVRGAMNQEDGDNPNFGPTTRFPIEPGQNYYISLSLEDSFKPWLGESGSEYARGSFATDNYRAFYSTQNALDGGTDAVAPEETSSVWTRSRTFAYCQPTGEAFVPSDYSSAVDPDNTGNGYDAGSTYLRGAGVEDSTFSSTLLFDQDDGSATLGLTGTNANYMDPNLDFLQIAHSYRSVSRFLTLLGYSDTQIASLLQPQTWSERNILTTDPAFPTPGGTGYALSTGTWPVEFNQASKLISSNHTWEFAGYFTYAKALPKYQDSPLTRRQRFDYITCSAWGGYLTASGSTESGENVLAGYSTVNSAGDTIPTLLDKSGVG